MEEPAAIQPPPVSDDALSTSVAAPRNRRLHAVAADDHLTSPAMVSGMQPGRRLLGLVLVSLDGYESERTGSGASPRLVRSDREGIGELGLLG